MAEQALRTVDFGEFAPLIYATGNGAVEKQNGITRLAVGPSDAQTYSDAQLDDYHLKGAMRWRPPVRLALRARFSHGQEKLRGTAGFGFWNEPFAMTETRRPSLLPRWRLPQAVWFFFASTPSRMPLALDVSGSGWKAATLDVGRPPAKVLLPLAPLAMIACRWTWLYRRIWPLAEHILGIGELMLVATMHEWHDYELEWEIDGVRFRVDGKIVFESPYAPRGPLGFVAWMDNQYMVATPQGRFQHGTVAIGETQWLEIASCHIAPMR